MLSINSMTCGWYLIFSFCVTLITLSLFSLILISYLESCFYFFGLLLAFFFSSRLSSVKERFSRDDYDQSSLNGSFVECILVISMSLAFSVLYILDFNFRSNLRLGFKSILNSSKSSLIFKNLEFLSLVFVILWFELELQGSSPRATFVAFKKGFF